MSLAAEYSDFLQELPRFPSLSYDRLISLIGNCPNVRDASQASAEDKAVGSSSVLTSTLSLGRAPPASSAQASSRLTTRCRACDPVLFPLVTKELEAARDFFNGRIHFLLHAHLASGVKKAVLQLTHRETRNPKAMLEEGRLLMSFAVMTTRALNSILEEYDKLHRSSEGSVFKSWIAAKRIEAIHSPWLVELLALYFNLTFFDGSLPAICDDCVCDLESAKPMLSCIPHPSVNLEIEVTCPICLEILFEPVALKCTHIFCFSCACAAASVPTFDGLLKAKRTAKCPICREVGVFPDGVRLTELHLMVKLRCNEYWENRRRSERKARVHEAKDFWKYQSEDIKPSPFKWG